MKKEHATCKECDFCEGNKCHRFPPMIKVEEKSEYGTGFTYPTVDPNIDWCEEFKLKSTK